MCQINVKLDLLFALGCGIIFKNKYFLQKKWKQNEIGQDL